MTESTINLIQNRKRNNALRNEPNHVYRLTMMVLLLVCVVTMARLIVSNTYATRGATIDQLESQLSALQEENWNMQKEASNLQSLQRIESLASKDLSMQSVVGGIPVLKDNPLAEAR